MEISNNTLERWASFTMTSFGGGAAFRAVVRKSNAWRSRHVGRQNDISVSDAAMVTLKINWAGKFFVAIQCAASNAGNFLIVDDRVAVLHDGDKSADECDVKSLPNAGPPRLFWIGRKETVNRAYVMV